MAFFIQTCVLYLWISSLLSFSHYAEAAVNVTCIRAKYSSCKFYCGQDILDFSVIDGSSTQPSFSNIPDSRVSSVFYQWSPCTKFVKNCSDHVNVCRVFQTTGQSQNLGDEGPSIVFDQKRKRYQMGYVGPEEHLIGRRKTDVYLEYDGNSEGRTSPMRNYGDYFTMTLYTKYVPHGSLKNTRNGDDSGLSAGSVILIVILCITVVYLGIGMPYMKFQRGARGREMIPHYSFWSEIPALAKDGCSYTVHKMQCCTSTAAAEVSTRRNYERI